MLKYRVIQSKTAPSIQIFLDELRLDIDISPSTTNVGFCLFSCVSVNKTFIRQFSPYLNAELYDFKNITYFATQLAKDFYCYKNDFTPEHRRIIKTILTNKQNLHIIKNIIIQSQGL